MYTNELETGLYTNDTEGLGELAYVGECAEGVRIQWWEREKGSSMSVKGSDAVTCGGVDA